MRKFLVITALTGALALTAACTKTEDPYVNAVQRYGIACDAYSTSLNVLAAFKAEGKLSATTISAVDHAVAIAKPVCEADSPPVGNLSILTAVEQAVINLIALREDASR